jgi:filamentous hemagglutinin family protein
MRKFRLQIFSYLYFFIILPPFIFSLPQEEKVVFGSIKIDKSKDYLNITQSCSKAIIDWREFTVLENEKINIIQDPSFSILNRVSSNKPSEIYGTINASGSFYLVNQNGIIIGPNGQITAKETILSTLHFSKEDYLNNNFHFISDNNSSIVNKGVVKAINSDIFIISKNIENFGLISSNQAKVNLVASNEVYLLDKKQNIIIKPSNAKILNEGDIKAIEINLKSSSENLDSYAICNKGLIEAKGSIIKNGKVLLISENGITQNFGKIIAKSENAQSKVHILGDNVLLLNDSYIDVSSTNDGGEVLIGGDFQGKNPNIKNSKYTFVSKDSIIDASSKNIGNGGRVILWGDDTNHFFGTILAKGGGIKGDGGFVEVSGKNRLNFNGDIYVNAFNGKAGTLLLDPSDITISAAADSPAPSTLPNFTLYDPGNDPASENSTNNLNNTTLQTSLDNGNNVTISSSSGTLGSGNITISSDISWSAASKLTLIADQNITISAGNTITASTTSNIDVMDFQANLSENSGSFSGIVIDGTIQASNGNIILEGHTGNDNNKFGVNVSATGILKISSTDVGTGTGVGTITINGYGQLTNVSGINAVNILGSVIGENGDLAIAGSAQATGGNSDGVYIQGILQASGSGAITINGIGGDGSNENNFGVQLTAGTISSDSGDITITGTSTSTGSYNIGLLLESNSSITSDTGIITIENTNGGGENSLDNNQGVLLTNSIIQTTGSNANIIFQNILSRGTTDSNEAIRLNSSSQINCSGSGNITMTNISGGSAATGSNNSGVVIYNTSQITTTTGDISISALSDADNNTALDVYNNGIQVANEGIISSSGGAITLIGTGGSGNSYRNHGILVDRGSITNTSGAITLTGTTNAIGDNGIIGNTGIDVISDASIPAIVSSVDGNITIQNTIGGGVGSGSNNSGVLVTGSQSKIETTGTGSITFSNITSNGTLNNNSGVEVLSGAQINCSGSGNITMIDNIVGGALATGSSNYGVYVDGTNSKISTNTGSLSITATSNASAPSGHGENEGIEVEDQGAISSSGGAITLIGTGGRGDSYSNHGIHVDNGIITNTLTGTITLTGTTQATGDDGISVGNMGIAIENDGVIDAVVSSVDGNITIQNTIGGGVGSGSYNSGVLVTGSLSKIETTGAGSIIFSNINSNGTLNGNSGVEVISGAQINCSGSGNITMTNNITGGDLATGSFNYGVHVHGTNSKISTTTGNISITTTSNAINDTGSDGKNNGIQVANEGVISSSGGAITLIGTGGRGNSYRNHGIHVDIGSITNTSGAITLTGTTQGIGDDGIIGNLGIHVGSDASIPAIISSVDGNITIQNTIGGGVGSGSHNSGVLVTGSLGKIETTGTGSITFSNISSNGTLNNNSGVEVLSGAQINCSGSGNITMTNNITGGDLATGSSNYGVYVDGTNSKISTNTGSLSITATSNASAPSGLGENEGIEVEDQGAISSSGGAITLIGTGGSGGSYSNHGIHVDNGIITNTLTGTITLTGTTQATGDDGISLGNTGIDIESDGGGAAIISSFDGDITITSTIGGGVGSGSYNSGVRVIGSLSKIETTGSGDIIFSDIHSNGILNNNGAISLTDGATIQCTSTGNIIATNDILGGNIASTGIHNYGLSLDGVNTKISTFSGDITIVTTSASNVSFNEGCKIANSSSISSQGGDISLTMEGGGGISEYDHGISIESLATITNTGSGNITLKGTTRSLGTLNVGVNIQSGASIIAENGLITISDTFGGAFGSSDENYGIQVTGTNSVIRSTGAVSLGIYFDTIGSKGLGAENYAIFIDSGGVIECTGNGPILMTNIDGGQTLATGDLNIGLRIDGASSKISTNSGSINITSASTSLTSLNTGILISNAAQISSTSGDITLNGTGGSGTGAGNIGVHIRDLSSTITTGGALFITGFSASTGSNNTGVMIGGATPSEGIGIVEVTGSSDLTITGSSNGAVTINSYGVIARNSGTKIRSTSSGNIIITGTSNASGFEDGGVKIESLAEVTTTGSGNITINGTGLTFENPGFIIDSGIINSVGTLTINTNDASFRNAFILNGTTKTVDGGVGLDHTIEIKASGYTWTVDSSNAGSISGDNNFDFQNYQNLRTYTTGSSTFNINVGGSVAKINSFNGYNIFNVNGGDVTDSITARPDSNNQSGTNLFVFQGDYSISGLLDGDVNGISNVIGISTGSIWTINSLNGGYINPGTSDTNFVNMNYLTGGSLGVDTFTLTTPSAAIQGNINGNGAINSLYSSTSINNKWTITGTNAGTITPSGGSTSNFTNIQNLTGGSAQDHFYIYDDGIVTGLLSGGLSCAESNILDYTFYNSEAFSSMPPCSAGPGIATNLIGGIAFISEFIPPVYKEVNALMSELLLTYDLRHFCEFNRFLIRYKFIYLKKEQKSIWDSKFSPQLLNLLYFNITKDSF